MSDQIAASQKKPFAGTIFPCALLLVVAVNIWICTAHPLHNLPTAALERGEAYNAISSFRKLPAAPEVVLLGSSLVTAPVMQSEAEYQGKPILRMSERQSSVLQQLLAKKTGHPLSVFCLAIGGEMVSDAYLLTKHLLASSKQPAFIIYGIGPRDFQDNLMPGVETSETFQVLAGLSDLPDLLKNPQVNLDRKVNMVLERVSALWRYRADIRTYLTLRMKKTMERCLPYVVFEKYDNQHDLKPRKRGQFPEEAKGEPRAYPGIALDHLPAAQTHNEYFWRYNPLSKQQVTNQGLYLDRLLSLCRQRGIKVVVVNMPLSADNLSVMPKGLYEIYQESLRNYCQKYSTELVDLNTSPINQAENFVDTVHLTPQVSKHFLDVLCNSIHHTPASIAVRNQSPTNSLH